MTRTLPTESSGTEWLSVKAAATSLGVSTTTIHKLIQSQEIPAADVSTGKSKANWRIRREDWDRYLDAALARTADRFKSAS